VGKRDFSSTFPIGKEREKGDSALGEEKKGRRRGGGGLLISCINGLGHGQDKRKGKKEKEKIHRMLWREGEKRGEGEEGPSTDLFGSVTTKKTKGYSLPGEREKEREKREKERRGGPATSALLAPFAGRLADRGRKRKRNIESHRRSRGRREEKEEKKGGRLPFCGVAFAVPRSPKKGREKKVGGGDSK